MHLCMQDIIYIILTNNIGYGRKLPTDLLTRCSENYSKIMIFCNQPAEEIFFLDANMSLSLLCSFLSRLLAYLFVLT